MFKNACCNELMRCNSIIRDWYTFDVCCAFAVSVMWGNCRRIRPFYMAAILSTWLVKSPFHSSATPLQFCHSLSSFSFSFVLIPGLARSCLDLSSAGFQRGKWHLTCNFMVSLHLPLKSQTGDLVCVFSKLAEERFLMEP